MSSTSTPTSRSTTESVDADAVSLLQRDLGAQVIGEIDAV